MEFEKLNEVTCERLWDIVDGYQRAIYCGSEYFTEDAKEWHEENLLLLTRLMQSIENYRNEEPEWKKKNK